MNESQKKAKKKKREQAEETLVFNRFIPQDLFSNSPFCLFTIMMLVRRIWSWIN